MNIKKHIVLNKKSLLAIQNTMQLALSEWSRDWLSNETVDVMSVKALSDHLSDEGSKVMRVDLGDEDDQWLCAYTESNDIPCLAELFLFDHIGETRNEGMVFELIAESLGDLVARFSKASVKTNTSLYGDFYDGLPQSHLASSATIACIKLQIADRRMYLFLPSYYTQHCVDKNFESESLAKQSSISITEALANQSVGIQAVLGDAELSLQALSNISVGDVVSLDKRLDEPAFLNIEDDAKAFRVFLGKKEGGLAVRLVSHGD